MMEPTTTKPHNTKKLLFSSALGGLLLLLLPAGGHAFNFAPIGRRQEAQQRQEQQLSLDGQGQGQPTDRGVGLGERVPRPVRSVRGVRCPACLSADSDEFVLFLQDAMPPLLSSSINGGAGGRTQALRAVEGLLPSDQALYLYTHKPWIGAPAVESNQEEELAAMAEAAALRWAP